MDLNTALNGYELSGARQATAVARACTLSHLAADPVTAEK
jgi:hypothetical protein